MQAGLDAVWPLTPELFRAHAVESRLAADGVAVDPSQLRDEFVAVVEQVLEAARLRHPADGGGEAGGDIAERSDDPGLNGVDRAGRGGDAEASGLQPGGGGRDGVHGEELVAILDEMQGLARAMPGSTW
jgi:ring-1,2-phenylacetyl-CoA epoxidase subunit PaaC